MHSCWVFTSYLQSRTKREEKGDLQRSFFHVFHLHFLDGEQKNVAHPNVIAGDRGREMECLLR